MAIHADAPTDVPVTPLPLSAEQRHWREEAVSRLDEDRMRTFDCTITSLPSPTGTERAISEWLVQPMRDIGLMAYYQPIDEHSGNAIGQLPGTDSGACWCLATPVACRNAATGRRSRRRTCK
jgi:hypothetical protein